MTIWFYRCKKNLGKFKIGSYLIVVEVSTILYLVDHESLLAVLIFLEAKNYYLHMEKKILCCVLSAHCTNPCTFYFSITSSLWQRMGNKNDNVLFLIKNIFIVWNAFWWKEVIWCWFSLKSNSLRSVFSIKVF